MRYILFIWSVILMVSMTNAQLELPEDKVSWKISVEQDGEEAFVVANITVVKDWHIYAANLPEGTFTIPTTLEIEESKNYKVQGKVIEPKPHHEHDDLADEDLYYHSGTIKIKRKIKVTSEKDFTLKGVFGFQTCDDTHCLPPHEVSFEVKVKGFVAKDEEEQPEDVDPFKDVKGDFAKDEDGNDFVKVNDNWYKVPEGNSAAFYQKYLMLGGKHEE